LDSEAPTESARLETQYNMGIVSAAAERQYLEMANQGKVAILGAVLLYAFAIYMIISIVVIQTASVLRGAGIHSIAAALQWWSS
jgi:hypothetical protein